MFITIKKLKTFWETRTGKVVTFLVGTVFTTIISIIISNMIQKENVEVIVRHLSLNTAQPRHVYEIEIENKSNKAITKMDLHVKIHGRVYSSMFDGRTTTHVTDDDTQLYKLEGEQVIKDTSSIKTMSLNYNLVDKAMSPVYEFDDNSESHNEVDTMVHPSIWYDLALGSFSLKRDEKKVASIFLNHEINEGDLRCESDNDIFTPNNFIEVSSEWFETLLATISTATGTTTGKIHVEGIGVARETGFEKSRVFARNKAMYNLYKEIAQKLYGISVVSMDMIYLEEATSNDSITKSLFNMSNRTQIATSGVIDKQSVIVYSEYFEEQPDGSMLCLLKALYKLPLDWPSEIYQAQPQFVSKQTAEPIVKEGKVPQWFSSLPEDPDYLYAAAVGPNNLSRFVALRFATTQAYSQIAAQLDARIQVFTKEFEEEIGTDFTSFDKITVNVSLMGARVKECSWGEDGHVFVLVEMPIVFADREFLAQLKSNKAIHKKVSSTKGFKELEEEVRKYEQQKAKKDQ